MYDAVLNRKYEYFRGVNWDNLMFAAGDEIVVIRMGKFSCMKYFMIIRKWRYVKE